MKVLAAGRFLVDGAACEADTVIVGCSSVDEVRENLVVALGFTVMPRSREDRARARIAPTAARYDYFKAG